MQVEAHNGTGWDTQAEMSYNGLGQRLSMESAGVIAHYVMDGDQPLTAESAGNTTYYLYGLGQLAKRLSPGVTPYLIAQIPPTSLFLKMPTLQVSASCRTRLASCT